ncbi:pyridoxamine 5'-phosphate oxidase family protein [Desulfosarcina sp.]|uniref:pyridoxamine 5'-phosphate oxidase family protein n=1 Tax=Desulfosarcina sp. TaxID=2027861 RepID=UPI0029B78C68|nr:pyridoxamine 5'-phosphate oxidase family protein [Desulfosarcina sp.]MDX2455562.1 pyridoxamine 5'-phosphate oxidase family protein [Desulfosarcina sp.]
MSREEHIRHAVHDLLQQQQLGVLSTVGEDGPYASLVALAVSDDDRRLFFVTPRATRKFANLTANARVALLVNNSINHPEDFHQAAAVTAIGSAQPVSPMQLEAIRNHYLAKHPYLESFANSPSCEFVEIQVERYIMVERFQNVTEYRIDHDLDRTT